MNRDNGYELPPIYGDVLSRGFHHPKSRTTPSYNNHTTPSLDKDSATESKAWNLVKFLDPEREASERFKIQPPGYSTVCQMTSNSRLMLKHL